MEDQFSFFSETLTENDEISFLNDIFPLLEDAVDQAGGDPKSLKKNMIKESTTVLMNGVTIFQIRLRKKAKYIKIPKSFQEFAPKDAILQDIKSEPKYIRILLEQKPLVSQYKDLLVKIAYDTCISWPKTFDCCSRYMQCSDEKKCVHPDKSFALECGYRKILSKGTIFYGKNRNID